MRINKGRVRNRVRRRYAIKRFKMSNERMNKRYDKLRRYINYEDD